MNYAEYELDSGLEYELDSGLEYELDSGLEYELDSGLEYELDPALYSFHEYSFNSQNCFGYNDRCQYYS